MESSSICIGRSSTTLGCARYSAGPTDDHLTRATTLDVGFPVLDPADQLVHLGLHIALSGAITCRAGGIRENNWYCLCRYGLSAAIAGQQSVKCGQAEGQARTHLDPTLSRATPLTFRDLARLPSPQPTRDSAWAVEAESVPHYRGEHSLCDPTERGTIEGTRTRTRLAGGTLLIVHEPIDAALARRGLSRSAHSAYSACKV
jgi:hypothetical protein